MGLEPFLSNPNACNALVRKVDNHFWESQVPAAACKPRGHATTFKANNFWGCGATLRFNKGQNWSSILPRFLTV